MSHFVPTQSKTELWSKLLQTATNVGQVQVVFRVVSTRPSHATLGLYGTAHVGWLSTTYPTVATGGSKHPAIVQVLLCHSYSPLCWKSSETLSLFSENWARSHDLWSNCTTASSHVRIARHVYRWAPILSISYGHPQQQTLLTIPQSCDSQNKNDCQQQNRSTVICWQLLTILMTWHVLSSKQTASTRAPCINKRLLGFLQPEGQLVNQ